MTSCPAARSCRPGTRFCFPRPSLSEWLCLIGGLLLTWQYAWLMDDAYVYFRYADNLIFLHRGLVFNAGEYVEGYSSPLWMLLICAARLTGLNYWIITRVIGVLAFVAFWALLVVLNRRLSPRGAPVVNVPLCLLSVNYAVLCYFTSGLETPLVQVAAVAYALFVIVPRSAWLQIALATTPLLRHELVIHSAGADLALGAAAESAVAHGHRRRAAARRVACLSRVVLRGFVSEHLLPQ